MITIREIEKVTMTPEKRKIAKNDYFAFYIGRPISYLLTIPFLYTRITPNAVSVVSMVPLLLGTLLMYIGESKTMYVFGWLCFFLWNLLDGVDGNIARYKKQFSRMGSIYDAMSGYVAMILSFFAWGIAAAHSSGWFQDIVNIPSDSYIIAGALSGIFVIFPRFIMHKIISTIGTVEEIDSVKDKAGYGVCKIVALNLISISGFVQVLMLLAVVFDMTDLFTMFYFVLNFVVMVYSLKCILTDK